MTIYDSSLPVTMEIVQTGPVYTLHLVSYASGSPALGANDAVRASTVESGVVVIVSPGSSGVTITSVSTTGYRETPNAIPWTSAGGVFTGGFPAPEQVSDYIWDMVVTFTTTARTQETLDPKMIVRKTNL